MRSAMLLATASLVLLVSTASADRVLVLTDNAATETTHSIYLNSIKGRGHDVTVKKADDSTLTLIRYGEIVYDHLVVLASAVDEFGGTLSASSIARFVDLGGNVLVATSSNTGEAIRELAMEHGFEVDDDNTALIDHFNYDTALDEGLHTTVVVRPAEQLLKDAALITGDISKIGPILYRGVALVGDKANELRLEVARATSTAYSFDPKKQLKEAPVASGRNALLVGTLQARNNARFTIVGSLWMFSDAAFKAQVNAFGDTAKNVPSGNQAFVTELTKWTLKEQGVLRVNKVTHHKKGEQTPPREYTIKDTVEYTLEVDELKDGKWRPFAGRDVQLAVVRIDPFVRTKLANSNGRLHATVVLPDVYGVFKLSVDYRRRGFTHLNDVQQISVRPLWHTQYDRFIRAAYPYYVSSFSMMAGVIVFAFVFLYHKDTAVAAAAVAGASAASSGAGSKKKD